MFPPCAELWYVGSRMPDVTRLSLLNPSTAAAIDHRYNAQLRGALTDKYAIVVLGHCSRPYAQPEALRATMASDINRILQDKCLRPEQVVVVARGMAGGIGEVYAVARDIGTGTLGILPRQGAGFQSPDCKDLITVDNCDADDWSTTMPGSREEMTTSAMRIANSNLALGGEVLVYNGGQRAFNEALAVAREGFAVRICADFDPLETDRERPFQDPVTLERLQKIIHEKSEPVMLPELF